LSAKREATAGRVGGRAGRRVKTALVVYKKSAWEQHVAGSPDKPIADSATRGAMLRAHRDNARAMDTVIKVLDRVGISWRATARARLLQPTADDEPDLVISIGGDGTFLAASHQVGHGVILGVNSSPEASVGFFCACTGERFEATLARALAGTLPVTPLSRLETRINGKSLAQLALNDVLITHKNPGATSRYALRVGRIEELQRSSGLWISTPAGSTAGIRAAGGTVLPLRSDRIQFVVRELYVPPGDRPFRLKRGLAPRGSEVRVICRMVEGALFIDGPRQPIDLYVGDRVAVRMSSKPLQVLGLNVRRGR
jgi:NAD+ kinase